MTADPAVRDALASAFDDYESRGVRHDVPPHRVYEVAVDGRRAVLKLATHPEADPATEARVMAYVEANTTVPVPHVLAVGEDYFVAEWHDGVPRDGAVDEAKARAMGAAMATLHAETAGDFTATGFPRAAEDGLALDAHGSWHETACALVADLETWLEPTGHADVAAETLVYLRAHPDAFDGAGDPVLCHGNVHPEHAGVEDGGGREGDAVTCVLDFEHALVAPAGYDVWRTALPLLAESGEAIATAFREGYEAVRPLPDGFDRRGPVFRLVQTVSYFRSLYLQGNLTGEAAAAQAETMREYAFETLADLCAAAE